MTSESTEVRDHLARTRTALANERTLLAYVRTALAMAISGVGALKLFTHGLTMALGWILIVGAVGLLVFGLARCRNAARRMRE